MADIYLKVTRVGPFFNGVLNTNIYKLHYIKQSTALPGLASSTPTDSPRNVQIHAVNIHIPIQTIFYMHIRKSMITIYYSES